MEKAVAVANYFIEKSTQDRHPRTDLTNIKLNKLVYIAHGWHLAITGEPLIEESAEAWKFGPVIRSVYSEFREYGRDVITSPSLPYFLSRIQTKVYTLSQSQELKDLLDQVWKVYGKYTAGQLVALTHQDGTPWSDTWHLYGGKDRNHVPIHNALIKEHYEQKLSDNKISDGATAKV